MIRGELKAVIEDLNLFRPAVMDAIIQELPSSSNSMQLTDTFMPRRQAYDEEIVALLNRPSSGRTAAVVPGAEHARVPMFGGRYVSYTPLHFREAVKYTENDFMTKRQDAPLTYLGQRMVDDALSTLDLRMNNLVEHLTSKMIFDNGFTINENGVNITVTAPVPSDLRDINVSTNSDYTQQYWSTTGSAKPVDDIVTLKTKLGANWGMRPVAIWVPAEVEEYLITNTTQITNILVSTGAEGASIIGRPDEWVPALTGLRYHKYEDRYEEVVKLTAAAAAGDTSLSVTGFNTGAISANDTGMLVHASTQTYESVAISAASVGDKTVTVGTLTNAFAADSELHVYRRFIPKNKVLIECVASDGKPRGNWFETPGVVGDGKSIENPTPGRYTWRKANEDVPPTLEIGAGLDGCPVVFNWGTWATMQVAA